MAEKTQVVSLSLKHNQANWLKEQKEITGLPESHFVEKGLELVINGTSITLFKDALALSFYFFVSVMLFIFGILFYNIIPLDFGLLLYLSSGVGVIISSLGLYKVMKIWIKNINKWGIKKNVE